MSTDRHILLLGLGEVGSALATGLSANVSQHGGVVLKAWDWQFADSHSKASINASGFPNLRLADSAAAAAQGCGIIISAVTAAQDLAAAESVLAGIQPGTWFVDLNSVSPVTRQDVADAVKAAGGRYVEAAVLSPIAPLGMASPILIGGPHAAEFLPLGQELGFSAMKFCSDQIGQAAATKMCRSVIVKGIEALLTEALLAARHYGVENEVLASLQNLLPGMEWQQQSRYMISRSIEHGLRRAEEMREAARTVAEAGIEPLMSEACVARQDWAPQFAAALQEPELAAMLDRILAQASALRYEIEPTQHWEIGQA